MGGGGRGGAAAETGSLDTSSFCSFTHAGGAASGKGREAERPL